MKKSLLYLSLLSLAAGSCEKPGTQRTATFKVWGNCDMCKHTIDSAASLNGVSEAAWNTDSKLMTLSFDTAKVSLDAIQQSIAKAGYDNDKYYGDDYAYGKLQDCCQYERKPYEMN